MRGYALIKRIAYLITVLLFVQGCFSSNTPLKIVLVSGVDPQHAYLQKQIQFLEEVFETLNYKLEVRQYQSAHCLELSNSGQVDGELWRIEGLDAEYKNLIRVPVPLWSHPELAFVYGDIELDGWKSLSPYRVAFRAGTKVVENNIRDIVVNQVAVASIDEAFSLLEKGDVDVVISDNIVGSVLLKSDKYKDSGIRQLPEPLDQALLYTYLHKKHQELVPELARSLRKAKRDGTYQRIVGDPPV